jgi:anti-sigma B factor antagonist
MKDQLDGQDRRADFDLDVERVGDVPIVVVMGDVDLYTAPALREQLVLLTESGEHRVIVDLSGVTFLDSMGLGVLVGAKKRAARHDGGIDLVVQTPEIRRIFEITMLDEIFDVYESRATALTASR